MGGNVGKFANSHLFKIINRDVGFAGDDEISALQNQKLRISRQAAIVGHDLWAAIAGIINAQRGLPNLLSSFDPFRQGGILEHPIKLRSSNVLSSGEAVLEL